MQLLKQLAGGLATHLLVAVSLLLFLDLAQRSALDDRQTPAVRTVWYGGGSPAGGQKGRTPPAATAPRPVVARLTTPSVPVPQPLLELPGATARLSAADVPAAGRQNDAGVGPGAGGATGPRGPGKGGHGTGPGPGLAEGPWPGDAPGVVPPVVLHEQRPEYTADAMRAKVQGTVLIEAVVDTDGTVREARVVRSLDSTFGLDQKAVEAVSRWRFRPGRRFGQVVPVRVLIELTFTLR